MISKRTSLYHDIFSQLVERLQLEHFIQTILNHRITETDLRFEYNFWAYGTGNEYRGARRLAPFITAGLGATFYGGPEKGATMNVPLGAGVKYKIGKRLNLTVEWAMRFTLSDKLDGSKDPLGIKSSGLFKRQWTLGHGAWQRSQFWSSGRC